MRYVCAKNSKITKYQYYILSNIYKNDVMYRMFNKYLDV